MTSWDYGCPGSAMDGTQMNMEMQVKYFEYWDQRVLFYLVKCLPARYKGESYENCRKCIHVSILDFIHFPDDDECYRGFISGMIRTTVSIPDKMELQILELKEAARRKLRLARISCMG